LLPRLSVGVARPGSAREEIQDGKYECAVMLKDSTVIVRVGTSFHFILLMGRF